MKKINAIIIEDEIPARDLLKKYLTDFDFIDLIGEFDNGFDGLKAINEMKPDVVFLDVQMPKLTGFEILEVLDHQPEIIFTTAFDQYAIRAFEQNAVDYLLKPFSRERFAAAVMKLKNRLELQDGRRDSLDKIRKHFEETNETIERVVIKKSGKIHLIPISDIDYFEAQDDYVMIYAKEGRFLKQQTMRYFEKHLDPARFIRVHRSYIVNVQAIERIEPYEKTNFILILKAGQKISVSRNGMQILKERLDF
ncbi:MAG: LytTR family transcriptional regulator DNA-binding domain-containing protein [Bacteroidales bacterium]|nr:LytTR family transcriptional regulator DNA-binding domain-containing protein [Bacteroidales bacterium]MBN2697600.1 LytTR family transcriptional regulator DNA-binding domain-containing protein [Bacteroidales bacterium]